MTDVQTVPMTEIRRVYVLICEFEIIPKTISTRNRGAYIIMGELISAYVYVSITATSCILADTGID
jgi:N-acyl homoserine lactone hydrolase